MLLPAFAQSKVTVSQLKTFLSSRQARTLPDIDLATRFASIELSEHLTMDTLQRITANMKIGPKAAEQLVLLSAESSLNESSPDSHLDLPAPDPISTDRLLQSARDYVSGTLSHLPDFIATRSIRGFDNTPLKSLKKGQPIDPRLHWVRESHHEVAYRNGHELLDAGATSPEPSSGLSSHGEYGTVLSTVFGDIPGGSIEWANWQRGERGATLAVYRYSVPKSASHYLIDFCCYQNEAGSGWLRFRENPAYHGEIDVQADSGRVERITIQADMSDTDPLQEDGMMVEYAPTTIDGRAYFLPVYSVTRVHTRDLTGADVRDQKDRSVKSLNELSFSNYHKFGSTSRILLSAP